VASHRAWNEVPKIRWVAGVPGNSFTGKNKLIAEADLKLTRGVRCRSRPSRTAYLATTIGGPVQVLNVLHWFRAHGSTTV